MKTSDLWFSAYLIHSGYKLSNDSGYVGRKYMFSFDISEDKYREERMKFFNSELSKHKQTIEELKDLMH